MYLFTFYLDENTYYNNTYFKKFNIILKLKIYSNIVFYLIIYYCQSAVN